MLNDNLDINGILLDRCRRGDRNAQYELYQAYARAMYNVCLRIVNSTADAEDILQESFLDAFGKLGTFRGEASFGAWLKMIVVNRSVNHLRKKKLVLLEAMPDNEDTDCRSSYDNEEVQWEVKRVHEAINKLPDGYRIVLSLYLLEGYDHAEIGEILNVTGSTSKSQYSRAKKQLVELLNRRP